MYYRLRHCQIETCCAKCSSGEINYTCIWLWSSEYYLHVVQFHFILTKSKSPYKYMVRINHISEKRFFIDFVMFWKTYKQLVISQLIRICLNYIIGQALSHAKHKNALEELIDNRCNKVGPQRCTTNSPTRDTTHNPTMYCSHPQVCGVSNQRWAKTKWLYGSERHIWQLAWTICIVSLRWIAEL